MKKILFCTLSLAPILPINNVHCMVLGDWQQEDCFRRLASPEEAPQEETSPEPDSCDMASTFMPGAYHTPVETPQLEETDMDTHESPAAQQEPVKEKKASPRVRHNKLIKSLSTCPHCGAVYPSNHWLAEHLVNKHILTRFQQGGKQRKYHRHHFQTFPKKTGPRQKCQDGAALEQSLKAHEQDPKKTAQPGGIPIQEMFPCKICHQIIVSLAAFQTHCESHKTQSYECPFCHSLFDSEKSLDSHWPKHFMFRSPEPACENPLQV